MKILAILFIHICTALSPIFGLDKETLIFNIWQEDWYHDGDHVEYVFSETNVKIQYMVGERIERSNSYEYRIQNNTLTILKEKPVIYLFYRNGIDDIPISPNKASWTKYYLIPENSSSDSIITSGSIPNSLTVTFQSYKIDYFRAADRVSLIERVYVREFPKSTARNYFFYNQDHKSVSPFLVDVVNSEFGIWYITARSHLKERIGNIEDYWYLCTFFVPFTGMGGDTFDFYKIGEQQYEVPWHGSNKISPISGWIFGKYIKGIN